MDKQVAGNWTPLKSLLAMQALAIAMPLTAGAANSAGSGSIPVDLTLAGNSSIDISATSGLFADAVSGVNETAIKSTSVSVNCTNGMPFKLGVSGGEHYTATRHLSDGGIHEDIPYTISQAGVAFGDADIVEYDTSYTPTSTENAYAASCTGIPQSIAVNFEVAIPNGQASGAYSDSIIFVVAWP